MPLSPVEAVVAVTAIIVGAIVQGSVGFGAALVAAPVLMLLDRAFIPGPMMLSGLTLAVVMTWREWQSVDLSVAWAIGGRMVGIVPAILALGIVSDTMFSILFATLILLAVGLSVRGWRLNRSPWNVFLTGIVSGFAGTLASIGGPPLGLLYQHEDGKRLRGTIAFYFVIGGIMSLTALWLAGHFGMRELVLAGVLIPGMLVGYLLSHLTAPLLDAGRTRPAVLIVSATMAGVVLVRAMW